MALLSEIIKKHEMIAAKKIEEARRLYGKKNEDVSDGNVVILNPWATGRVEKGDLKPSTSIWKAKPLPRVQSKVPVHNLSQDYVNHAPRVSLVAIEEKVRHIEQMLADVKRELAVLKGRFNGNGESI